MPQVGNLRRYIKRVTSESASSGGGLTFPPHTGAPHHYAEGTIALGGTPDNWFFDNVSDAGGTPWIEVVEDRAVRLLRSGIYTFQSVSVTFHAGASGFANDQGLEAFLGQEDDDIGTAGNYFCWSKLTTTTTIPNGGMIYSERAGGGPSQTRYQRAGDVIGLNRSMPNDGKLTMWFGVIPLAYAD